MPTYIAISSPAPDPTATSRPAPTPAAADAATQAPTPTALAATMPAGELLRTWQGGPGAVRSVAFRLDGSTLAAAGDGGTVALWAAAGD